MNYYLWQGVKPDGKPLSGTIKGKSSKQVKKKLYQKQIFRIKLESVSQREINTPLSDKELLNFINSILRLLNSGITLYQSIKFLVEYQNTTMMTYILLNILEDLEEGESLYQAFGKYKCFPPIFIHMIRIGESSDQLYPILKSLIYFFDIQKKISTERKNLIRYPLIVLMMAFILFLGLLIFVIPMFQRIFSIAGDDLFIGTKILVSLSSSITSNSIEWIIFSIIFSIVLYFFRSTLKISFYNLILGKKLIKHIFLIIYTKSLSLMLSAGIDISEAFILSEKSFSSQKMISEVKGVHHNILNGGKIAQSYSKSNLFSHEFIKMIALGEESENLSQTYGKLSDIYQEKLEEQMKRFNSLLEPVLMVLISLGIVLVLLSIYLPIFQMKDQF